ncbi:Protein disulfide-isomerase [Durusdinium trenchii]|uniref:Protein disulfide-isomerase n=1 Tax=Durusdinium trenchii TaxID=1381693 RepID=A0ABP0NQN7_9DINO
MAGTVQLFLLMLAVLATAKPPVRWAQSNSTLYLELSPPKGQSCQEVSAEILFDRVVVSSRCADGQQSWELELREDVWTEHSRLERLPNRGTLLLMLRKKLQHRWDRPLMDEASFTLPKDWKREDTSLPEEDEMELPRAQNIKRFGSQEELQEQLKQNQTLVLAMRYPWCTACEEKDKAFVKVSKVVAASLINASKAAGKDTAQVRFGAVDLREAKVLARRLWSISELHECRKTSRSCPLLVFKPDEPLEEPYQLQVQLLYEMDEAAMMADPMAGMPGHKPQGQTPKPDYKRFQHELSLLLPPAVHHGALDLSGSAPHGRSPWVLGRGVNATEFRWAARNLRGIASFARTAEPGEPAFVKLWRGDGSTAIPYNGPSPLNSSHLEDFTRIHAQPIVQNYSWALRDSLDAIGLPLGVLWVNYSDGNSSNTTHRALSAFEHLCSKRRGTNRSQHILCCVMDQSHAYHQREYGSHEPYPFPFFGLTHKLGFHAGDRYGYPFREPVNASVYGFFSNSKRAARQMDAFAGRVLRGRVPPSHESNVVPNRSWRRGEVQEIVWKTYQKEINGSTADVLLELYDDQRKKHHWLSGSMDVLAQTLKDYADLKVARMEVSQSLAGVAALRTWGR